MATSKAKKTTVLSDLEKEFKTAKSVAFSAYRGINVTDLTILRRALRAEKVRLVVAKKTLIKLAAKNAGLKEIPDEILDGPVATAFAHGDELAPAQALQKFSKTHESIGLLGGVFDGAILSKSEISTLANLPGRDGLLGQIVGLLASPLRGLVCVLNGNIQKLAIALSEVQKKKVN